MSSLVGLSVIYVATFLHLDLHRMPPRSHFVVAPRLFYFSTSSLPLFCYNEVHGLLHHRPRLLFGRMVYLLHTYPMFSFPHLWVQVRPAFPPVYGHPNHTPLSCGHTTRLAFLGLGLRRRVGYSYRTDDMGL